MTRTQTFAAGNYGYVPGVFQYSAGVVALPGFEIVHVSLAEPLPLAAGFRRAAAHLDATARPLTAFCACELRSPAPYTEAGFKSFNELYVGTLGAWGIYRDVCNPVARSNVCPKFDPPSEPSMYAFAYTRPVEVDSGLTCIVAGSGEVPEGHASYAEHIVAPGDTSPSGMRRKASYVTAEMKRRLTALGFADARPTTTQVYTVQPLHDLLEVELLPSGLAAHGLVWHYCRPPITGLEFEMDCRIVRSELVI
jgi:hypothetical protein